MQARPSESTPASRLAAHEFDTAIRLLPDGDDRFRGETSPAYANMVGPFGGVTAATLLNAACRHPARLGDPVALTVNFAGPIADGPFIVVARAMRTNRATQHWSIELRQDDQVATTASAMFALRRDTWAATEAAFPEPPPAASVPPESRPRPVAWLRNYDLRFVRGVFPDPVQPNTGSAADSVTSLWVRDEPPRPLDFLSLAAISDVFFPRIFLRRQRPTPAGTVSLTTYFHADGAALARQGDRSVFGVARALRFGGGFFDQSAEIWGDDGMLLASSHQVVYFKD